MKKTQSIGDTILNYALNNKALVLLILAVLLSVATTGGKTLTAYNLASILRQVSTYAIIAAGYTIMLSSGSTDLSVGEIVSLVGVIFALCSKVMPLWAAIIIGILVAMLCEFINGFFIRFFNLPAFVLTLGTQLIFKSITYTITEGKAVGQLSDASKFFGQGVVGGIPMPFIIAVLVTIGCYIIANKTLFGRHTLAVGGNANAAKVSGIRVDVIKVAAHVVMGICIGIGAIVLTGRVGSAGADAGNGLAMDCIAAVVIGGTPLSGGKSKVVGTLFGVSLIMVITNMLNLMGVSPYFQWMSKGAIMIIAIILDSYGEVFFQRQRAKAIASQKEQA